MEKSFKLGLIVGRFQHLTKGHMRMINAGLSACEHLLLLVSSSQESGTVRNPFKLKTRLEIIKTVYDREIANGKLLIGYLEDMTNENDVCVEWGDFVLNKVKAWTDFYGIDYTVDCMIYGNDEDRMAWFDPEKVKGISKIILARSQNGSPEESISATKIREMLCELQQGQWEFYAPRPIANNYWFEILRDELLEIPHYKEMAVYE